MYTFPVCLRLDDLCAIDARFGLGLAPRLAGARAIADAAEEAAGQGADGAAWALARALGEVLDSIEGSVLDRIQ